MSPIQIRLKELREKAGMSQAQLAAASGLRQATISDLETGTSKGITFETANALGKALGIAPHLLFETEPAKPKK